MGHPIRVVHAGDLFHSFNRSIGHRTLVDDDVDGRQFVSLLAELVDRQQIRVRSFCIMMTHFHLLIESIDGQLGDAMRLLEGVYARGFNRRRPSRDGHLLRGRYRAKRVSSAAYQSALINYIDMNPVVAGLVSNPGDYPFGSAALYQRDQGPAWLDRTWVEREVRGRLGLTAYSPAGYARCFGARGSPGQRQWFESLMSSPAEDLPTLDDLVRASPPHVLQWLDERSFDADGMRHRTPLADLESISLVIADAGRRDPELARAPRCRLSPPLQSLLVGLLRDVGGLTFAEIGVRVSTLGRAAAYQYEAHRRRLAADESYRSLAVDLTGSILRRCHVASTSDLIAE